MWIRSGTIALALVLGPLPAARADWSLSVEGLSDLPVQVGGRVQLEIPGRLHLSTSLGVLPKPYVELINAVVVAAGKYDQDTADLIEQCLQNSMVWRLHLGWRPFADYGFYLELGYGLVTLGGGLSGEELIELATGKTLPEDDGRTYDVSSTLHMIDAELGWRFVLWQDLTLRVALGFTGTLWAKTNVEPDFPVFFPHVIEAFTRPAERYLNDKYTTYVFMPTVTVALGWRFF